MIGSLRLDRRRSLALMVLGLITAALFIAAGTAARMYRNKETNLARYWYEQGEQALAKRNAAQAIEDLRSALAYSRNNKYRLRLAQALVAAGHLDEARAHLLTLREQEPGDGRVNLQLARLAAAQGSSRQAAEYYHHAVFGAWEENPAEARRNVRFEAAEFFLKDNDKSAAESELIALASNLPRDAAQHTRVAELFLRAGDQQRALDEYRSALSIDPLYLPALRGAGNLEFANGDYLGAREYLERALRQAPAEERIQQRLQTAELVLRMDPFAQRLPAAERARRAAEAFRLARRRVEECAAKQGIDLNQAQGTSELPKLYAEAHQLQPVNERELRRDSDRIFPVMDWVGAAEAAAAQSCGEPSGADLALLLMAGRAKGR